MSSNRDGSVDSGVARILIFLHHAVADFKIVFTVGAERRHVGVKAAAFLNQRRNQFSECLIVDQYCVGIDTRREFEFIQGTQVERIGYRDEQIQAAAEEGNRMVLDHEFRIDLMLRATYRGSSPPGRK